MPTESEIAILAPRIVREAALPRRLQRRARFIELGPLDDVGLLAHAFRVDPGKLAPAPLHYLGVTGDQPMGYCLFAYPVYLHARREQLILMTGPEFELSDAEARSLVEVLRQYFPQWRIERTSDAMWFILLEQDPDLETTPLQHVLGENINDHLPRGRDAMQWHKILNEVQMLLFDSEVNLNREAAGQPPVNSLWLWGGGRLPEIQSPPWQRIVTNNPVAQGMARLAGLKTHWLEQTPAQQTLIPGAVTTPGTLWLVSRASGTGEQEPVLSMKQWQALGESLRCRALDKATLIEPGYGELTIDSRAKSSWWPW